MLIVLTNVYLAHRYCKTVYYRILFVANLIMKTLLRENGWQVCVSIEVNLCYRRPYPLDARNLEPSINLHRTCTVFQA